MEHFLCLKDDTKGWKGLTTIRQCKSDLPWETAESCVVASDDSSLRGLLRDGNPAACNYEDVDSPFQSKCVVSVCSVRLRAALEELVAEYV